MTVDKILVELKQTASVSRLKSLINAGADINTFGTPLSVIRNMAKELKINHLLAEELWHTKNTDARLLAVMLFDPKQFTLETAIEMIEEENFEQLLDDLMFRCMVYSPIKEEITCKLFEFDVDHMHRAAWAMIISKIADKKQTNQDYLDRILKTIEEQLVISKPATKWMMNRALCEIGFRYEAYTDYCIQLGERLAVYQDMVVAPGCTSAYAPNWIRAVLKRKK